MRETPIRCFAARCAGMTLFILAITPQASSAATQAKPAPATQEMPAAANGSTSRSTAAPVPPGTMSAYPGDMMQAPPMPGTPTPYGPLPPPAPAFRDTPYGAYAYPGPPGSTTQGHPNYPTYQTRYGVWYQPRSYHEHQRDVYRPRPFRPRGWGELFYEPCRADRMDYARPVVENLPSRYGPAYYPNYQPASECLVRPERHYTPPVWGAAE